MTTFGLLFGGIFLFVGALLVVAGRRPFVTGVRLLRSRTVPVESLTAGRDAAVTGTVREYAGTVRSPFSDREAVVAGYEIQEYRPRSGQQGTQWAWETVDSGWNAVPFVVDDGTGRVLVEPDEATFSVSVAEETRVATDRAPSGGVRSFVESDGHEWGFEVDPIGAFFGHRRRYLERRVVDGDTATVRGRVEADERAPSSLVVRGGGPFVVGDGSLRDVGWRSVQTGGLASGVGVVCLAIGAAGVFFL